MGIESLNLMVWSLGTAVGVDAHFKHKFVADSTNTNMHFQF